MAFPPIRLVGPPRPPGRFNASLGHPAALGKSTWPAVRASTFSTHRILSVGMAIHCGACRPFFCRLTRQYCVGLCHWIARRSARSRHLLVAGSPMWPASPCRSRPARWSELLHMASARSPRPPAGSLGHRAATPSWPGHHDQRCRAAATIRAGLAAPRPAADGARGPGDWRTLGPGPQGAQRLAGAWAATAAWFSRQAGGPSAH